MAKKVCVIGGANIDINATSSAVFRHGDSNPGKVRVSWGGVGRNIAHNLALLGDEVELLTIFGGGIFAPVIAKACSDLGIGTARCEIAGAVDGIGVEGRSGAPDGDGAADGSGAANAFFVAVNNCDGELIGGVADMKATDGITPEWLAARIEAINGRAKGTEEVIAARGEQAGAGEGEEGEVDKAGEAGKAGEAEEAGDAGKGDGPDAVVVDANVPVEAIAWLIDNCEKPLYIDAVSVAKAGKIRQAVAASRRKKFFALKCNALEYEALAGTAEAERGGAKDGTAGKAFGVETAKDAIGAEKAKDAIGAEKTKDAIEAEKAKDAIGAEKAKDAIEAERIYVTAGAKGLRVIAEGQERDFPALPANVRNVTGGGDALLAGIVHAGPEASIEKSARAGLLCAKCAVESEDAVSSEIAKFRERLG